jgi:hypothetical protein
VVVPVLLLLPLLLVVVALLLLPAPRIAAAPAVDSCLCLYFATAATLVANSSIASSDTINPFVVLLQGASVSCAKEYAMTPAKAVVALYAAACAACRSLGNWRAADKA